ncbi:hypothetical protein IJT93_10320 [bacterium]|nr:hypothetical protein [bacterium]
MKKIIIPAELEPEEEEKVGLDSAETEEAAETAEEAPAEKPAAEEKHFIKECRLLWPGTFNGRTFTPEHLQKCLENFAPEVFQPPIQIDHEPSSFLTVGHVISLFIKEDVLYGLLEFKDADAIEKIKADIYRYLSVGVELDEESGDCRLIEVSITSFPAAVDEKFTARILARDKSYIKLQQANLDLSKRIAENEQKIAELQKQLKAGKTGYIRAELSELVESGHITPAQVHGLETFMQKLSHSDNYELLTVLKSGRALQHEKALSAVKKPSSEAERRQEYEDKQFERMKADSQR